MKAWELNKNKNNLRVNSKCFTNYHRWTITTYHCSWYFPASILLKPPNSPTILTSQRGELEVPAARPPAKLTNRARMWDLMCLAHKSDSFHPITLPLIGSINPYGTLKGRYYPRFREAGCETRSAYQTSLQLVNGRVRKAIALKSDHSATY